MKKTIALTALAALLLAGCSNGANKNEAATGNNASSNAGTAATPANSSNAETKTDGGQIEVDKGLLNTELTLPASFFEGDERTSDQIIADVKSKGVKEVTANADGSYTYKMSKSVYNDMLKETEKGVLDYTEKMTDGTTFQSIKSVDHNKALSEFTVTVDKAAFESSFDAFAGLGLGVSAMMYQAFSGVAQDKYKITIHYKDADTKEVFNTVVYPDVLDDTQNAQ
ncbi:hypothetical protein [Paenibacillus sp. JDR-2]|uniref:hypothetical protein n=1 Tax=Paenibacillus sp. (strain JDR-2) TaxID=324057 RepID=UPI0001664984|nr:hypothetical protein [Paenibacillus sp. JDR-2]ACT04193.1 hypothetical protein Pjdr2_5585 [Paenibacillus sp. JDR-2]